MNYLFLFVILYLVFCLVYFNVPYIFTGLSSFYQLVSTLNSKNNLLFFFYIYSIIVFNSRTLTANYFNIFYQNKIYILFSLVLLMVYTPHLFELNMKFISSFYFFSNSINFNLLNGVMLIHPIILYVFYNYCIVFLSFYVFSFFFIFVFKKRLSITFVISFLLILFTLIFKSIILGSWWAEQELSWGGWWSWDFIELTSLNLLIFILLIIHFKKNILVFNYKFLHLNSKVLTTSLTINYFFLFTFYVFIVLSIIPVRFNLINSIHNFINIQSENQYAVYLFILLFILLLFIIFLSKKVYHLFKKKNSLVLIQNGTTSLAPAFFMIVCIYFIFLFLWSIGFNFLIKTNFLHIFFRYFIYLCILFLFLYFLIYIVTTNNLTTYLPNIFFICVCSNLFFFLNFNQFICLYVIIFIFIIFYAIVEINIFSLIHLLLFYSFFFTFNQFYVFFNDFLIVENFNLYVWKLCLNFQSFATNLIKSNTITITKENNKFYNFTNFFLYFFQDTQEFNKNNLITFNFLLKYIFEKKLISSDFLYIFEFFSYNNQFIFQKNTLIFFIFIFSLLMLNFLLIRFTIKTNFSF